MLMPRDAVFAEKRRCCLSFVEGNQKKNYKRQNMNKRQVNVEERHQEKSGLTRRQDFGQYERPLTDLNQEYVSDYKNYLRNTSDLFTAQHSTAQCSTVQHSTAQHSTVQYSKYSTVQYSTVQYSTVQYSTVQYSTVQYSKYSTVQYSTAQHSTAQYSTAQYSTV
ncbi:histone h1-like nucleoprotein hc2 [Plakobranchus ocellatus]|uniref:Histone h1-like nucleoprotein hc2 n=1 Tax=Plakobranchus ocellatus TaxID=259542 RepID=A0AAV4E2X7_9GAST|nr:histone h1-like nucleoprotein hc2 [Plakobranchus ocellatus]